MHYMLSIATNIGAGGNEQKWPGEETFRRPRPWAKSEAPEGYQVARLERKQSGSWGERLAKHGEEKGAPGVRREGYQLVRLRLPVYERL